MKVLNRKLLRDIRDTRGQVLAIALVIAAGIATCTMSLSNLDTLKKTRADYYQDYRFADVFASAKRAPEYLAGRIENIPGVGQVQTRVVAAVKLSLPGFGEPINGKVVSVPDSGGAAVNRVFLRRGRDVDPTRDDEVILNEVFADAHGLQPGDSIEMIVKGRLKEMRIVGIGLSPEFIYQIGPGSIIPDYQRYGVLWMARDALDNAYDMDGAFNDVVLTVTRDANIDDVMQRLDLLLEPYGGLDAIDRQWQVSHRFLSSEFDQLEQNAVMFSIIFLGIAAFLLNIVVSRMIGTQREQIASLKAFGYSNTDIGLHYLGYVTLIVVLGLVAGLAGGIWLGRWLSDIYLEYYRFPYMDYELRLPVLAAAFLVTAAAAIAGTLYAVIRAARLPPARAMQPEPPPTYHATLVERLGLQRFFAQPSRMILRHIERKPVKSALTVMGIALACAVMVMGTFFRDAIDFMVDIEFKLAQRQDLTVNFTEPTSIEAFYNLLHLEGVQYGEPFRAVPVTLSHGHREYRTSISGSVADPDLSRSIDTRQQPIPIPRGGVVLTDFLGDFLSLRPGDEVTVQVLEGRRPRLRVPVAALASQYIGVGAYMNIDSLNRILKEGRVISGAYLKVDPAREEALFAELREMPRVAGVGVTGHVIENFYETMGRSVLIMIAFISVLAGVITFGVVYNSARIALTERSRELASMRVLGFTRGEISYILLGELFLLTLLALPLGLYLGYELCRLMIANIQLDLFRVPLIIEPATYALAATVVLIASVLSSLLVRHRLDHLDLIAVLKTKE